MVVKNQEIAAKYGWDIFLDGEVIAHQITQANKAKEASGAKGTMRMKKRKSERMGHN